MLGIVKAGGTWSTLLNCFLMTLNQELMDLSLNQSNDHNNRASEGVWLLEAASLLWQFRT